MELSNNIAYLRKQIGLSQEGLAEKLDLSRQAIAKWENGSTEPSVSALIQMSDLFNVSIDNLILKEYCKPIHKINTTDSNTNESPLRIVEFSGYDIADMVLNFIVTGEIQVSILYLSAFDGVIFQETPANYGTVVKPDNESLKRLFYRITAEVSGLEPQYWYMVTDASPDDIHPFISWLKNDFEDVGIIDTFYILHEENPDYDYKYSYEDISLFCIPPSASDFEEEMNFIKRCMQIQEYEGPFPPKRLYKRLLEEAPEFDLPYWFMTGDFSQDEKRKG